MKYFRFIPYFFLILFFQIVQLSLNVLFMSFEFNLFLFLIVLVLLGTISNPEKFLLPVFLTGIFYDIFFSTFNLGIYSTKYILILLIMSYATELDYKNIYQKFFIFSTCFIIYNFINLFEFKTTFFTMGILISFLTSFLIFISIEKFIKR